MEEAVFIERLLLFGLGRQEAALYLCLLKNRELTGYEVAKLTGISRSNVYSGLASLVEHGGAYVIEGTSCRYVAVPLEEFCDNRIRYLAEVKKLLESNVPKPRENADGYITVEGYGHICNKIHHMLLETEKRVYFSAAASFLKQWKEELRLLVERDCKVVLIAEGTTEGFSEEERQKMIFYEARPPEDAKAAETRKKQIRLIIDSAYVLTGELDGTERDTCLYSAQKNFVAVFKDALRNEIELIRLRNELLPEN